MKNIFKFFYILFIALFFVSCKNNDVKNEGKLQVYASIYPMYDFASKIGGDKADVYNMTPSGVEPHDFEIVSKDIVDLENGDIFIYNGEGMEHWVDRVLDTIKNVKVVKASEGISIITDDGYNDPHVWLYPLNAKKEMENIKNAFVEVDPENRDYYEENYKRYSKDFDDLDFIFKNEISKMTNKNIVVSHPAFGYLCKAYNLNQVAIVNEDFEPDPKTVANIIDFIKKNNIKTVYYEELSTTKLAKTIADATGTKISVLNPIESLTEEEINDGVDYFLLMKDNLNALKEGMD